MEYDIQIGNGILQVISRGSADAPTFRKCLDDAFGHAQWKQGMSYLFDHSNLDSAPLTIEDVQRIAKDCLHYKDEFGESRLAVVLRRDLEFGLARMWSFFVDGRWDANVGLYRSRDDAMHWLMR